MLVMQHLLSTGNVQIRDIAASAPALAVECLCKYGMQSTYRGAFFLDK